MGTAERFRYQLQCQVIMSAYTVVIDEAGGFAVEMQTSEGRRETVGRFATEDEASAWMTAGNARGEWFRPSPSNYAGPPAGGHNEFDYIGEGYRWVLNLSRCRRDPCGARRRYAAVGSANADRSRSG